MTLEGQVTIEAPSPSDPKWAATNLITNLSSRTAGNNLDPFVDMTYTKGGHESCYKTTNVELAALNHQLVININFGKSVFQHAFLLVQD